MVEGYGSERYEGRDAYVAYVREALKRFSGTQHLMGNQVVDLRGDTAHVRTDVQATHFLAESPGTVMTLWATYIDVMVRVGGEWKISRHELFRRGAQTSVEAG